MDKHRRRAIVGFVLSGLCMVALCVVAGAYIWQGARATGVVADPTGQAAHQRHIMQTPHEVVEQPDDAVQNGVVQEDDAYKDERFPAVDWQYWQQQNDSVIAWITVPGTRIDGPVVLAPAEDPQYYLTHDVYKQDNVYGCAYLDADCAEMGFGSMNCIVMGHHMANGSMFADFARYTMQDFFVNHPVVLLQVPGWKRELTVLGACVVSGGEALKQTEFANTQAFQTYCGALLNRCKTRVELASSPEQLYTFVTCSYEHDNDRTLVLATQISSQSV